MFHIATIKRKTKEQKVLRSAAASRTEPRQFDFSAADPSKWVYTETPCDGAYNGLKGIAKVEVKDTIASGIAKLKSNPKDYQAILYQASMTGWPKDEQEYTLFKRSGSDVGVEAMSGNEFTFVRATHQTLSKVHVQRDKVTDRLHYDGKALGNPVSPGRGSGVADVPGLCIVKHADPNDISQGQVGDCWLLSAISALAEYEGAIKKLFRKTPNLNELPADSSNTYVVTLFDLATWKEVDIEIDERLCCNPEGGLFGCRPSVDGELWPCYLEKAIAVHCGGWDAIDGGQCTHAWRLLLGCKDQYVFLRDDNGKYMAWGKDESERLANSPHECSDLLVDKAWPQVGGGCARGTPMGADEMFEHMCAWHDANYIMCAGSQPGSDTTATHGVVKGHAYTILELHEKVAGTHFNMIKMRNPHGNGEFDAGKWIDNGPGWERYPKVTAVLGRPVQADDGVFWMDQEEFFKYFPKVYLCAMDMKEYLEKEAPGAEASGGLRSSSSSSLSSSSLSSSSSSSLSSSSSSSSLASSGGTP